MWIFVIISFILFNKIIMLILEYTVHVYTTIDT